MSLEAAVEANTAAIKQLIAIWTANGVAQDHTAKPAAGDKVDQANAAAAAKTQAAFDKATKGTGPPANQLPDYDKDIKPLALALSKAKSREALIAVLTTLGLKHTNDATPEQYPGLLKALTAAMAA